ncbi:MAG: phenylalanine--tRNA ligase subunit alpha [Acidimicrobiales bacterium]
MAESVPASAARAGSEAGEGEGADAAIDGADIDSLVAEATVAVEGAASTDEIRELAASLTGKQSPLVQIRAGLGALEPESRASLGRQVHAALTTLERLLERRRNEIATVERARQIELDRLDLTELVPAAVRTPPWRGHLHLVTQAQAVLEDVFVGMGFEVAEGPEVETDWYNFGALNIPPAHPARSMWDSFYLKVGEPETVLLRTHTSPVQIHLMEKAVAEGLLPIHAVMPGRCYRRDTPDARHLAVFHQIEGLIVDRGITFADLAGTIEVFTTAYFGPDIHSRWRPGYFPFTEPSAEFDVTCTICNGEGCRTCSQTGWVELGGCGMVDPAVFAAVGIDPEEWTGFAFGFGIDRLAAMRHQIADLRSLTDYDIRFLRQF